MIKKIMTVVLMLLMFCGSTAFAMEPVDIEVMLHEEYEMTVEDVVAVGLELGDYQQEIRVLAKLLYGEARGVDSTMEQAAVVWCVLNRVDCEDYPNDIIECATAYAQFTGYTPQIPVKEDMAEIVKDVLIRWLLEKRGVEDVGRVLPPNYLWFASHGDGHNWFRFEYRSRDYWDWSLPDPY